jgi:transcriptional regulator with XRE-family HTH domain
MLNLEIQHLQHNVGCQHLSSGECWSATNTRTVSISLGKRIKDARQRKKLTLKAVGTQIGRSHATLSQIENDVHQPEKATLIALAKVLEDNFGESWLDEHIAKGEAAPSKKEIVEDMTVREFVSLKFGGKKTRRSPAEIDMLTQLLDAEIQRIKEEEEKYGSE